MIIRAFKTTSIPVLNIKAYLMPIHHIFKKIGIRSVLQIAETFFYNLFLSIRSNQKNRCIILLETLIRQYKVCLSLFINQLGKKLLYIILLQQKTLCAYIKLSKKQAKLHHQQIFTNQNCLNHALFYTDESGINSQIKTAFILLVMNFTIHVYFEKAQLFTIYLEELVGILLALQIAKDHL